MKAINCAIIIALSVSSNCDKATGWSTLPSVTQLNHKTVTLFRSSKCDDASDDSSADEDHIAPPPPSTASFGVSYIGGDPCGSKYNDDPFDVHANDDVGKPGMPEEMKDRIAAMAAEILKSQQPQNE
eukprot:scaffold21932_cov35-Cyclotella_meneghiniana.AAC.5